MKWKNFFLIHPLLVDPFREIIIQIDYWMIVAVVLDEKFNAIDCRYFRVRGIPVQVSIFEVS